MGYIENPKTKSSGILCCIPQTGLCPNKCEDCFFQSGRSYLEPLSDNLPNIPPTVDKCLYRINDGNDSNVHRREVIRIASQFPMHFYNTALAKDLGKFDAPVVLTLNPGDMTDKKCHWLKPIPTNLMFVRFRINTWNLDMATKAVDYYSQRETPIVLTFMAYFRANLPKRHQQNYIWRRRTLNSYWAITTEAWEGVMSLWKYNKWVYCCGKVEGEKGTTKCRHCGNCIREYFATICRMREFTPNIENKG